MSCGKGCGAYAVRSEDAGEWLKCRACGWRLGWRSSKRGAEYKLRRRYKTERFFMLLMRRAPGDYGGSGVRAIG